MHIRNVDVDAWSGDATVSRPSVRGVYCTTAHLRVMHNGSLSKIMENSVRNVSSCGKPTNAILSRIVDLNALYQHPVPPRHVRFRFCSYRAPMVFL